MDPVRELRRTGGLTQADLAELGGTSQPTIAAYEAGRTSPTLRTLRRLAGSAGFDVIVEIVPRLTREDRRSLAWHRAIAAVIAGDPDRAIARAKRNVSRMLEVNPEARPLLEEWREILRAPLVAVLAVCADPSPNARELRAVTPFAGLLSARERSAVMARFRDAEANRAA